jgi:hypothetical protein
LRTCRDFYDASYLDQPCGSIADICRWEVFGSFAEQTKYASAPQSAKRPGPGRRKLTTARVVIVEVSRGRCPFILHAEICSLWPAGNTRHSHRGSFDSRLIPLCCNSAVGSVLLGLFQGGIGRIHCVGEQPQSKAVNPTSLIPFMAALASLC